MNSSTSNSFPVTIVAGLPGSGKTSLIKQSIPAFGNTRAAVLSDDPGLKRAGNPDVSAFSDSQLEWKSGDLNIQLSQDLLIDIGRLSSSSEYQAAVVEWHGTLDLMTAIDTFGFDLDGKNHRLSDIARLDTLVSVINASTFLRNYRESRELSALGLARGKYDERTLTDLLIEQIEWSDTLVLNKCDCTSRQDRETIKAFLQTLNPRARICEAEHGLISAEIIQTNRCIVNKVGRFETWMPTKQSQLEGQPGGICSMFFEAERPFHPDRLHRGMDPFWDNILRSKGLLWLASRPGLAGVWSQAGDLIDLDWADWEKAQSVLDSGPSSTQDTPPSELGKPRQQLLIVGIDLNLDRVSAVLGKALLTDEEMKMPRATWERFPDPFSFDAPVSDG